MSAIVTDESEPDFPTVPLAEPPKPKVDTSDWPKIVHKAETNKEFAKQFTQLMMAKGLMLKPAISAAVFSVDGVKSAGIGRSSTGARPCIRIVVDPTVKEEIHQKIAGCVRLALQEEWLVDIESILQMIEVNKLRPKKIFELQNNDITPGDTVEQVYRDTVKAWANITCFVEGRLLVEAAGEERSFDAHFPITCCHCLLPTQEQIFKRIVSEYNQPTESCLQYLGSSGNIPIVRGRPTDPDQVSTLLNSMKAPGQLTRTLEECETFCRLQRRPFQRLNYLAGKFGLFGVKMKESDGPIHKVYVDEDDHEENSQIDEYKFRLSNLHPCNVDVGVSQIIHDAIVQCSFEDTFICSPLVSSTWHPPLALPTWLPTPASTDSMSLWEDEVVMLNNVGGVIERVQLALNLSSVGDSLKIKENCFWFHFFSWENNEEIQHRIFSGSPAFLYNQQSNCYTFLGGLYTKASANNFNFTIDTLRPAISDAIVKHAISQLDSEKKNCKDKMEKTKKQREEGMLKNKCHQLEMMSQTLKQYCKKDGSHDNCKLTFKPCITSHNFQQH